MTKQEAYEIFFKQVEYKKIRYTNWESSRYFIPQLLKEEGSMMGMDQDKNIVYFKIGYGFSNIFYDGWVPYESEEKINIY